ncbi:MAG: ribonuclease III [Candidatus Portnoybacteria bacterium CG03_land_8_20_14_0_80_41_10]|uniref:Ribonuclease 3 n=1 Tax=Candidatus Portnoybacteria bacterium CG03_land_8_20_14_0_80_41_10 TaxID=1974808 RepID=A0A2M7BUL0_9BACT|nr:MAG: ribonuclease III [Candidatus Portnoybacteria bacterium CG03_land_8_20_14_0_80_41_10]
MELSSLEKSIGIKFNNKDLLEQSLVHRSYSNENPDFRLADNERLEFLGDAVLELIVTEYLYRNYPDPEGKLTNWRAALVNAKMLSGIAGRLKLGDYLFLSRGEAKDTGRARQYILANAFEALIGAIYLDQGYQETAQFIDKKVLQELPRIIKKKLYQDPKSRFQEMSQDKYGLTPVYEGLKEWGPDHAKQFVVGLYLNQELVAQGQGVSKQEAQEKAAQAALKKKGWA